MKTIIHARGYNIVSTDTEKDMCAIKCLDKMRLSLKGGDAALQTHVTPEQIKVCFMFINQENRQSTFLFEVNVTLK